jgi:hypothetical protein
MQKNFGCSALGRFQLMGSAEELFSKQVIGALNQFYRY